MLGGAALLSSPLRWEDDRCSSDAISSLLKGFVTDLERFKADPEAAEKYLSFGTVQKPADLLPIELAAYSLSANVIVNLDEFVMRE